MIGTLSLLCGLVFLLFGARLLVAEEGASWLVVVILPGGLLLTLIGLLGVLIPNYL